MKEVGSSMRIDTVVISAHVDILLYLNMIYSIGFVGGGGGGGGGRVRELIFIFFYF